MQRFVTVAAALLYAALAFSCIFLLSSGGSEGAPVIRKLVLPLSMLVFAALNHVAITKRTPNGAWLVSRTAITVIAVLGLITCFFLGSWIWMMLGSFFNPTSLGGTVKLWMMLLLPLVYPAAAIYRSPRPAGGLKVATLLVLVWLPAIAIAGVVSWYAFAAV